MSNHKDLLISIVNGNASGMIQQCVESIVTHSVGISYDIIVIDNCTGYGGLDEIRNLGVRVVVNDEPFGFAKNHSKALRFLDGHRYLLIFNDDAFLENNALGIMVDAMDRATDVAITGCRILDPDGGLQPSTAKFPTFRYFVRNTLGLDMRKGQRYSTFFSESIDFSHTQDVDWVSGCCMMLRREFVADDGFLDTGYFMYLEDADICLRAHQAGWKVRYIADAIITHHRGGSSKGEGGSLKPFLFVEMHCSRLRYLRKTSVLQFVSYFIFTIVFITAKFARRALSGDWRWGGYVVRRLWKRWLPEGVKEVR